MTYVQLSPDGESAAVALTDSATSFPEIWIYDLRRGLRSQFTSDGAARAVWAPNGRAIAYEYNGNIYQKSLSGLSAPQLLYRDGNFTGLFNWLPNGQFLVFGTYTNFGLVPLAAEPGGDRKPLLIPTSAAGSQGQVSPDGRWIATVSYEMQRFDVYVSPFPGPGSKQQLSVAGGIQPRWRKDGKEIFFIAPGQSQLMAAEVTLTENNLMFGTVRPLFGLSAYTSNNTYDVSADGQHVLAIVPAQSTSAPQPLTVVQNWTAALRK